MKSKKIINLIICILLLAFINIGSVSAATAPKDGYYACLKKFKLDTLTCKKYSKGDKLPLMCPNNDEVFDTIEECETKYGITSTTTATTATEDGWYYCKNSDGSKGCVQHSKGDDIKQCYYEAYQTEMVCKLFGRTNSYLITTTTESVEDLVNSDFNCESSEQVSITALINDYWKYITMIAPVGLILLISIDFTKSVLSSDAEAIKKSANAALKRTIACVLLLLLPTIINMIFNLFGLELCF